MWPLEGGYHDAITYNDSAMTQVMDLMRHVADGKDEYCVCAEGCSRSAAAASFERGIACILATQIVSGGKLTVWPQQDDALTLKPVSARNYEMPAESQRRKRRPADDADERSAASHREGAALDSRRGRVVQEDRDLRPELRAHRQRARAYANAGAGPIWARYYQIDTDIPIFGDRDKTIHDNRQRVVQRTPQWV